MNRRAFQKLAAVRLRDAKVLFAAKRYDAAYYLAGYAVECALKACIARNTKRHDFPRRDASKLYSHDLQNLVKAAGIEDSFQVERAADSRLENCWATVKDWKSEDR